jgi:hypothetical protein
MVDVPGRRSCFRALQRAAQDNARQDVSPRAVLGSRVGADTGSAPKHAGGAPGPETGGHPLSIWSGARVQVDMP